MFLIRNFLFRSGRRGVVLHLLVALSRPAHPRHQHHHADAAADGYLPHLDIRVR